MEILDNRAIPASKPKWISTSSTPTMGSVHNIKARISAPTIREAKLLLFFSFE
jgi:hypothetical protein